MKKNKNSYRWPIKYLVILFVALLMFYGTLNHANHGRTIAQDRMFDIKILTMTLSAININPTINKCSDVQVLFDYFENPAAIDAINEILEKDGRAHWRYGGYEVGVDLSGQHFVLRARVKNDTPHLEIDIDGQVWGCDCDDPYFCFDGSFRRSE